MGFVKLISDVSEKYIIILCDTDDLILISKGVRHFVYCSEKGWEPENVEKIEEDKYESTSDHCLVVCRLTELTIGTFRLIGSSDFPLMHICLAIICFTQRVRPRTLYAKCQSLAIQLSRNKMKCRQITNSFLLNGNRPICVCSTVECLNASLGFEKSLIDNLFRPIFAQGVGYGLRLTES